MRSGTRKMGDSKNHPQKNHIVGFIIRPFKMLEPEFLELVARACGREVVKGSIARLPELVTHLHTHTHTHTSIDSYTHTHKQDYTSVQHTWAHTS